MLDSLGCLNAARIIIIADTSAPELNLVDTLINCIQDQITLTGAEMAENVTWSGPDINAGNQNDISPLIGLGGIYSVEAIGENGCIANETVTVIADTLSPTLLLEADTITCLQSQITIDNQSNGSEFLWTGPGIDASNETNQSPEVTEAGVYQVVALSENGCSSEETITLATDTISPTAVLPTALIDCRNTSVILELQTNGQDFSWTGPGINGGNRTVQQPSVMEAGIYTVEITSDNGCIREISTVVTIDTVSPQIILDIPNSSITCENPTVTIDASASSGQSTLRYEWSRVEGDPVGGFPDASEITVDRGGNYILVLTDDANGCSSTRRFVILLDADFPAISIADYDELTCENPELRIDGSGSESGSGIRYEWSGPGITGVLTNSEITVTEGGVFLFSIFNDNTGCSIDTTIEVISLQDNPFAEVLVDGQLDCFTQEVSLSIGNSDQGPNYITSWTGPGVNPLEMQSAQITVTQAGNYELSIENTENGCTEILNFVIDGFGNLPQSMEITAANSNCITGELGSINITSITGGTGPIEVFLNGAVAQMNNPNLAGGSYNIMIRDANGCTISETVSLGDIIALTLDVGEDQVIQLGTRVFITALTNKEDLLTEISWIGDDVPCDSCLSFDFTPVESGLYILSLVDADSCRATDEIHIEVQEGASLYMPNVFSPNGDGKNDKYSPRIGPTVVRVDDFQIYNRKGHLVFHRKNFRDLGIQSGWDGTFRGKEMNPAVYTYLITYTLISGKQIRTAGDLTLIR